jgi:hypothetical protein
MLRRISPLADKIGNPKHEIYDLIPLTLPSPLWGEGRVRGALFQIY